jgi:hypothetical protein
MSSGDGRKCATQVMTTAPKKKKVQSPFNLYPTNALLLEGLRKAHIGKQILLRIKALFKTNWIPEGKGNYLWQYHIYKVNGDGNTAEIEFDERYIEEGGHIFYNYPNSDTNTDNSIKNYKLCDGVTEDHELFNVHLARCNKMHNNLIEAQPKEDKEKKVSASNDLLDIMRRFAEDHCDLYVLLVGKFEHWGELQHHTITAGPHTGKLNYKQMWRHKHSSYDFLWHKQYGKTNFVKEKLYKATRMIISRKLDSHKCLTKIMQYGKKPLDASDVNVVYPREIDMVKRVFAVFAGVGSKTSLSIFDNVFIRQYLKMLGPKHTTPYRLECVRIMEVLMDVAMMEFVHITKVGVMV